MSGRLLYIMVLSIALLFAGCVSPPPEKDGRMGVIVTIPPQAEFVERVGGDKVSVTVLVPPGADPHTYDPRPGQLVSAAESKVYALVGSGIEFELSWADKLIAVNPGLYIINCSAGIDEMESSDPDEPGPDPHVWTSVRNAQKMVENIYEGLAVVDPENRAYYAANRDAYLSELSALDRDISFVLSNRKSDKFIVYHPSWGYFARDYGLTQIAIEKEGKDPTPRWMETVIKEAKENNITVVFASPGFSTSSADALAREINGRVVLADPLAKDYAKNMRTVAEAFKDA